MERAWIEGRPRKEIASEFQVSFKQLCYHWQRGHVKKAVEAANRERVDRKQAKVGNSILESVDQYRDKVDQLLNKAGDILKQALEAGPDGATLALGAIREAYAGIREGTRLLELSGKLTGELDSAKYNLFIMPQWFEVRDTIFGVLEKFPEARQALLDGLKNKLRERTEQALLAAPAGEEVVEVEAVNGEGEAEIL